MNRWQASRFGDIWKDLYPNEEFSEDSKFSLPLVTLLLSPIAIAFSILVLFWRVPIVGIQLITLIRDPGWLSFFGLLLSIIFSGSLYGIATFIQASDAIKSISRYLIHDLSGKFTLQEKNLEEYIGEDKIQDIKAARLVSWNEKNQYPICRIFVRHPSLEGLIAGEKKGFAAPVAYYEIGAAPKSISLIFIDELPDELTDSSNFFIYHEIGHTTKHAWRVKTKPYTSVAKLIPLAVWILVNTNNYLISFSCLLVYILIRAYLEVYASRNMFEDEMIADSFAILKLPSSIPLDQEDNPRKNLQRILERSISRANKEDPITQFFNDKRLDNIRNIIKARKEKSYLSMTEKTRGISGIGMFFMNMLLIVSATSLNSPSILFWVCILFLSLVLWFMVGFIQYAHIIPGTHLIEETISQLSHHSSPQENICQG